MSKKKTEIDPVFADNLKAALADPDVRREIRRMIFARDVADGEVSVTGRFLRDMYGQAFGTPYRFEIEVPSGRVPTDQVFTPGVARSMEQHFLLFRLFNGVSSTVPKLYYRDDQTFYGEWDGNGKRVVGED